MKSFQFILIFRILLVSLLGCPIPGQASIIERCKGILDGIFTASGVQEASAPLLDIVPLTSETEDFENYLNGSNLVWVFDDEGQFVYGKMSQPTEKDLEEGLYLISRRRTDPRNAVSVRHRKSQVYISKNGNELKLGHFVSIQRTDKSWVEAQVYGFKRDKHCVKVIFGEIDNQMKKCVPYSEIYPSQKTKEYEAWTEKVLVEKDTNGNSLRRFAYSRFSGLWMERTEDLIPEDKKQGWKLHVSATPSFAVDVASQVTKLLRDRDVAHKVVYNLDEYNALGAYEPSHGKFITIYTKSDEEALKLAKDLDRILSQFPEDAFVKIPHDRPLGRSGGLFCRFGVYTGSDWLIDPDGNPRVDDRYGRYKPDWVPDLDWRF